MVEMLHTPSTYLAMEVCLSFYDLVIWAKVVQINSFSNSPVNQVDEIVFGLDKAWVAACGNKEKHQRENEAE